MNDCCVLHLEKSNECFLPMLCCTERQFTCPTRNDEKSNRITCPFGAINFQMHWAVKDKGYVEGYPGVLMIPEGSFNTMFMFWFIVLDEEQELAKS